MPEGPPILPIFFGLFSATHSSLVALTIKERNMENKLDAMIAYLIRQTTHAGVWTWTLRAEEKEELRIDNHMVLRLEYTIIDKCTHRFFLYF
jgi:hypothetical protein